jgi:hypothetical protein
MAYRSCGVMLVSLVSVQCIFLPRERERDKRGNCDGYDDKSFVLFIVKVARDEADRTLVSFVGGAQPTKLYA